MVDLQLLEKRGISAEKLKKILAPTDTSDASRSPQYVVKEASRKEKIANWKLRMRQRIISGRDNNLAKHKTYHALDLAWETPFRQISPTLLQSMIDRDPSSTDVQNTLKSWGFDLAEVIEEIPDPKNPNKSVKRVNAQAFVQIYIPLVRAYVTIRLAKIMNDRKRIPFLKYEPAINNAINRLRCEALTNRIEMMHQQYDYWTDVKQAVFQMLHYSQCFQFPVEEWHEEVHEVDKETVKNTGGGLKGIRKKETDGGETVYEHVEKEGLRYHMPHPSRTFIDTAYRPSTFNSDSGCEFAGYWKVMRYRDIRRNKRYYNTDKVSIGTNEWWASPLATAFFQTVYSCSLSFPSIATESNDRETRMSENYYNNSMDDMSVTYTEYFEKLIPSEHGFGDYDYPVWFRFAVAADDTILYAAPLPYSPVIYYGYDADELREQNASMSLEVLPFQDQFSNLMTQYLLTVRQNLSNATLVDGDIVPEGFLKTIKNLGQRLYTTVNFFKFSGREQRLRQNNVPDAFQSFKFTHLDSNAIVQAMKVVLDTLERVMVMSSQELGQAATHEQTRAEVHVIQSQTSTRQAFTAAPVDSARDAMKKQLYHGLMAYGEEEIWTEVPMDRTITKEILDEIGFTFDENEMQLVKNRRLTVMVKKQAIALESFAANRDGEDRIQAIEGGTAMLKVLQQLARGPLAPNIGPDQFLSLINLSAQLIGFPREFKLQNMGDTWDQPVGPNGETMQQVMQQQLSQVMEQVKADTQEALVPIMDAQKELAQRDERFERQIAMLSAAIQNQNEQRLPLANGR